MAGPFLLGGLLAPWLLKIPGLFSEKTEIYQAGLFLSAAIAITAFAILVIMAVVATLMASPVFEWVYEKHSKKVIAPLSDGFGRNT